MVQGGTPRAEDALRITGGTTVEDIHEFLRRRTKDPIVTPDGATIWNYSTHEPDTESIEKISGTLWRDRYVIPFPPSGAWSYMASVLPRPIREAELLVYSKRDGRYKPFRNYERTSEVGQNNELRSELALWLQETEY